MPTIRTLNQIVSEFNTFATNHRQINNFACGTLDDFATSGTTQYYGLWISYDAINYNNNTAVVDFNCFIVGRVKKDRSNLVEIHSDTAQIVADLRAQFGKPDYGWRVEFSGSEAIYEPFHEDEIAGWSFTCTITQSYSKDWCQIPFIDIPVAGSGQSTNTSGTTYVPTSRTITINGVTFDLSQNRTWTISTSSTPTLQQVTDQGNTTTNEITVSRSADEGGFNLMNDDDGTLVGLLNVNSNGGGELSLRNSAETENINLNGHLGLIKGENVQINSLTADSLIYSDLNKQIKILPTSDYPNLNEFKRVKGVTDNIQTQLNNKICSLQFIVGAISPTDATTYYFGRERIVPNLTASNFGFTIGYACTVVGALISVTSNSTTGTTELSTLQVRNITQSTSTSIGTFLTTGSSTLVRSTTVTGLSISIASSDSICLQWDTPTWVTNPAGMVIGVELLIRF